jgi:hypothetical protein
LCLLFTRLLCRLRRRAGSIPGHRYDGSSIRSRGRRRLRPGRWAGASSSLKVALSAWSSPGRCLTAIRS